MANLSGMDPHQYGRSLVAALLLICISLISMTTCSGQLPPTGPIRIDCGNVENASFTDENGLQWYGDYGYGSDGKPETITKPGVNMVDRTLRSFPTGDPCYRIGVPPGRFLIRVRFAYFNYDGENTEPLIGLLLNKVSVQVISVPLNDSFYTSFILDSDMDMLEICFRELQLVPFINAIEIYPQDKRAYSLSDMSQNVILSMHLRINVGGDELNEVADGFRKWDSDANIWPDSQVIPTPNVINIDVPWNFYHLPPALFQQARHPTVGNILNYTTDALNQVDGRNKWLVVLYFAELDSSIHKGDRVFDIKVNDQVYYPAFDILGVTDSAFTAYVVQIETALLPGGILDIALIGTPSSPNPPLLCGLEAFEMIQEQPDPPLNEKSPLRIDCGGPVSFKNDLGMFWREDQGYSSGYVSTIPNPSLNNLMNNTLRYFPDGARNCYINQLPGTGLYIVRLDILYADFDEFDTAPIFSVSVQRALVFTNYTVPLFDRKPRGRFDVLAHIPTGEAQVCFFPDDDVNMTDPFINGLEFLPIDPSSYSEALENDPTRMLVNVARINCGGFTFGDGFDNVTFGDGSVMSGDGTYPDFRRDKAWRVWHDESEWLSSATLLSSDAFNATDIINENNDAPNFWPNLIYESARGFQSSQQGLQLEYTIDLVDFVPGDQVAYYLHFAELDATVRETQRLFDILVDGKPFKTNYDVLARAGGRHKTAVYEFNIAEPTDRTLTVTFKPSANLANNIYGPIICAIEVYKIIIIGKATDVTDVTALQSLKKPMNIGDLLGWQGDPCDPENWDGLTCSDENDPSPWKILAIDLKGQGLNGTLPGALGSFDRLERLDLSNNLFSGPIPEEIGMLPRLVALDLSNNSLSGKIPDSILSLLQRNGFQLGLSGNPKLCGGGGYPPCRQPSKKFNKGAVAGAVVALVFLIVVITVVVCVLMRRRQAYAFQRMDQNLNDGDIIKGPETVGAAMDRIRKPRNLKLPPRGPALSRSDSLSSTGSSNNSRLSSRYEGFDVELGDRTIGNGAQENGTNGTHRQGSRLRPPVDDVIQVGFDGK